jgi:hypothetical protein
MDVAVLYEQLSLHLKGRVQNKLKSKPFVLFYKRKYLLTWNLAILYDVLISILF